jgi:hypothetical protein
VVAIFAYFGAEQLFRFATAPWGEVTSSSREAKKLLHPEVRKNPPVRARTSRIAKNKAGTPTRTHTHSRTHSRTHARTPRRHEHSLALALAHVHGANKQNECERPNQYALTLAGRSLAALRAAYESAAPRRSVSATSSSGRANKHNERFKEREIHNTYCKIVR